MWERHFAWLPVETNRGWRWFTTVGRKMVIDYDKQSGFKWIYKEIK